MSLLLDALKKAADDKQKKTDFEDHGPDKPFPDLRTANTSVRDEVRSITEELSLHPKTKSESPAEILPLQDNENLAELTIEIDDNASEISESADIKKGESLLMKHYAGQDGPGEQDMDIDDGQHGSNINADKAKYQLSDDALSMLVDKTNRDVKKGKTIVITGLLIATLIILLSGGVFYYLDVQSELEALESRHKLAMRSMQSKVTRENTDQNREIINNLVSDADLNEKVQYAKQQIAQQKQKELPHSKPIVKQQSPVAVSHTAARAISIQKSSKADEVSEKLDNAWLAYDNGEYEEARELYTEVIRAESKNRDALLGLGAIAVQQKDYVLARKYYSLLLSQDPDDPIATAVLTSLFNEQSPQDSGEEYLLSMLRKHPDAPHLNFSLANIYAQQGKWKSAQEYYFNAWRNDSDNPEYIYNLAVSLDQLNKRQQALNFYKESLAKSQNRQVSFSRQDVEKRIRELSGL